MKRFLTLFVMMLLCLELLASCGGTSCTHSDTDCDGKCDLCSTDFGEAGCKDSDGDNKCDNCGKPVEAPVVSDGIALVSGGKANFNIVLGKDALLKHRLCRCLYGQSLLSFYLSHGICTNR